MQDNIHDRLSGRRILVVEDDPLLAEELCELMRSQGIQILGLVFSLAHASQWLAEIIDLEAQDRWPDMAILDVRLKEIVFPFADALSLLGFPFSLLRPLPNGGCLTVTRACPTAKSHWKAKSSCGRRQV